MEIKIPNKPENILKANRMKNLSEEKPLEVVVEGDWIIIREAKAKDSKPSG